MKYLLLSFLLVFISCTDYIEIKQKNGVFKITELSTPISDLQEDDWKAGQEREYSISRGIKFDITIPQFKSKDKKSLSRAYNIDSWVFKISKIRRGSDITLGYFKYSLAGSPKVSKEITIHIYYQAASLSQRQRRQKCPDLDHNLKVVGYELKEDNQPFNIFVSPRTKIMRSIEEISFSPLIFAAGNSLKGTYKVELSLLNSATKQTYMNWSPADSLIVVKEEDEVMLKSCLSQKNIFKKSTKLFSWVLK
jgi:hypothetical protein